MISGSDIGLVLSGGPYNSNPYESLGGEPSSTPIIGTFNNLFDNVDEEEANDGHTDYRCIYVFNNSPSHKLYNTQVYIDSQVDLGAFCYLGIDEATDIQRISVVGNATGGNFHLQYEDEFCVIDWAYDVQPRVAEITQNIEDCLNGFTNLSGVEVSNYGSLGSLIFEAQFKGESDNRSHELLVIKENNIVGSPSITVSKVIYGAPINYIPAEIANEIEAPSGVVWRTTSSELPITIGELRPSDGFPVWVKRVTSSGTLPLQHDGFTLKIVGNPFIAI